MGNLRMVVAALLVVVLTGCGDGSSEADSGGGGATGPAVYEVLDEDCPVDWIGLTVTTESDAEVDYLDDMPACTNPAGDTTYLRRRLAAPLDVGQGRLREPV